MWLQLALPSLEFVGRSEVMHCIAPFACALKHSYEIFIYISSWSYILSQYDIFYIKLSIQYLTKLWFKSLVKVVCLPRFSTNLIHFPPPRVLELEGAALDVCSSTCAHTYLCMLNKSFVIKYLNVETLMF